MTTDITAAAMVMTRAPAVPVARAAPVAVAPEAVARAARVASKEAVPDVEAPALSNCWRLSEDLWNSPQPLQLEPWHDNGQQ
jgi:hypothetical protein